MKEQIVYLDSSVIVKRYIEEPGSSIVRVLCSFLEKGFKGLCRSFILVWNGIIVLVRSARYVNASQFLTGDKRLHEVAIREKLNSTYLE